MREITCSMVEQGARWDGTEREEVFSHCASDLVWGRLDYWCSRDKAGRYASTVADNPKSKAKIFPPI
ncbi:hypothetical protein L6164_010670 [Bauhinia variegata]|uniref:Uncharacterized protein n=1 Tax=Bauhinia variegata TaxID=167791 RepID=A0ACB9PRE5_BAUVA|nr:hypothetical protein L6164_010670 [Bauhinia variegata]